ncbi:phosphotransferase [Streptomyces sp. CS113]|uniref:phosphotransferase n=1 Tax=Streptomyces sp. CS113 TaxID=1982761 RepID=UPI0035939FCA
MAVAWCGVTLHQATCLRAVARCGLSQPSASLLDSDYTGPEAVVHGDLYPENLLMAAGTVSAVVDFSAPSP